VTPDFRELPRRVPLDETVEGVDVTEPAEEPGLPEPDRGWFNSGG
jgi:hypothetical protein